jgi:hypothetical protein
MDDARLLQIKPTTQDSEKHLDSAMDRWAEIIGYAAIAVRCTAEDTL